MSESFIVDYYLRDLHNPGFTKFYESATLKVYDNYVDVIAKGLVQVTIDILKSDIVKKNSVKTGGYNFIFDDRDALQFDKNSQAAADKFSKIIDNIIKTKYKNTYYESGNLYLMCNMVDGLANGKGKEFYDDEHFNVKYTGEFEKNLYDGEGTLYSKDQRITLSCKNFSKGKLYGVVTLEITKKNGTVVKKTLKAEDIAELVDDVNSYLINIASKYYPNFKEEFSTIDETLEFILNELKQLKETQKDILKETTNNFLYKVSITGLSLFTVVAYFL
jgi:hypothetical protein